LALTSQLVVQLYVVPRAEARKRREDRWERDVLALGELLTAEMPARAIDMRSAQWILRLVSHEVQQGDAERSNGQELKQDLLDGTDEVVRRYTAIAHTRMAWLVKRIVGFAPRNAMLVRFQMLHEQFQDASAVCTLQAGPGGTFDEVAFDKSWSDERQRREDLTAAVEELASGTPPKLDSWLMFGKLPPLRRLDSRRPVPFGHR
jgi:hypothetical protein